MNKELVIQVRSDAANIALLEDKTLVELHQEAHNKPYAVGDLYLGKIKKLVPGLNAAFVDVGYEKDGFLHYFDLGPLAANVNKYVKRVSKGSMKQAELNEFKLEGDINKEGNVQDVLKPGQEVLVQISKEPISTKGPRLSMELSIAGRYLVLVPFSNRISISSRIRDRKEKERLKRLIQSIKPANFGIIVRTVAENKRVAELNRDLSELTEKWAVAHKNLNGAKPKDRVLGELDKTAAFLRDMFNESFNKIIVDDKEVFEDLKSFLKNIAPEKENILKFYGGKKISVFDFYGINKAIKSAFGRNVTMSSGAYLVVEHTEALHVFDVNSGNMSKKEDSQETNALRVNMEAADEIARQLRLRDMGGIIVIDFIDMVKPENRKTLYNKLTEAMQNDRSKHYILPPSKFGLVQITRQRVRPEMEFKTNEVIADKSGEAVEVQATILLIDEIQEKLISLLERKEQIKRIKVHPFIEAYFRVNRRKYQLSWFMKYGKWIQIVPRTSYPLVQYSFVNPKNEEIQL
ncbi:MAG TPA: ribonuclease E/G [Flavobacteriales bacterium]|nr:ribonuclease E/G [Flavobacteriales bacterium]